MSGSEKLLKAKDWLNLKLYWNTSIRFYIQQYSSIVLASAINLYDVSLHLFVNIFIAAFQDFWRCFNLKSLNSHDLYNTNTLLSLHQCGIQKSQSKNPTFETLSSKIWCLDRRTQHLNFHRSLLEHLLASQMDANYYSIAPPSKFPRNPNPHSSLALIYFSSFAT